MFNLCSEVLWYLYFCWLSLWFLEQLVNILLSDSCIRLKPSKRLRNVHLMPTSPLFSASVSRLEGHKNPSQAWLGVQKMGDQDQRGRWLHQWPKPPILLLVMLSVVSSYSDSALSHRTALASGVLANLVQAVCFCSCPSAPSSSRERCAHLACRSRKTMRDTPGRAEWTCKLSPNRPTPRCVREPGLVGSQDTWERCAAEVL